MGNYFVGSVGAAEAFRRGTDGKLRLAFTSKTLTDSGLNISITRENVRAGAGASVQYAFFHDPSVDINLTDVVWRKEYVTAQLGAEFDSGATGQFDYITESVMVNQGIATPTRRVCKIPVPCAEGAQYIVWFSKEGEDAWSSFTSNLPILTVPISSASDGAKYCLRYLAPESYAKAAEITSTIVPDEMFLIIRAPIFAGDACAASKGRSVGHITFEVPRFVLNGAQEFSMNMSQNQTISLAGSALASSSDNCDTNAGKLIRITEVNFEEAWYSNIVKIAIDEDCLIPGAHPVVFGITEQGGIIRCPNNQLIYKYGLETQYTAMTSSFTFSDGVYHININAGTAQDPRPYLNEDNTVTVGSVSPQLESPVINMISDNGLEVTERDANATQYGLYVGGVRQATIYPPSAHLGG